MKSTTRQSALHYLARRDYSQQELRQKLKAKGHDPKEIEEVIHDLSLSRLLSNQRFTDNYIHSRRRKGYGPARISQELQERGIPSEMIAEALDMPDNAWFSDVLQVWKKRFRGKIPTDFQERAKQMRFLQYRGFTKEQIDSVFRDYK